MSKICTKKDCSFNGAEQSIESFSVDRSHKDGLKNWCKTCCKQKTKEWQENNVEHRKAYMDKYWEEHPDQRIENQANWYDNNAEYCKQKALDYYYAHAEEKAEYQKERFKNPEKRKMRQASQSKRQKELYHNDLDHRIKITMTNRINRSLRYASEVKDGRKWETLVDYTATELKEHIESLFTDGMTWELFLEGKIHIDHIRPISSYKITSFDCDAFRECWSLKNLQPLWAEDNIKKWAHIGPEWNNE